MSILQTIMSAVMSSAMSDKQPKKLDEVQKANLTHMYKLLDATTDPEEFAAISPIAESYGIDIRPYQKRMGIKTKAELNTETMQNVASEFLRTFFGSGEAAPSSTQQTPQAAPTGPSAAPSVSQPTPAPSQAPAAPTTPTQPSQASIAPTGIPTDLAERTSLNISKNGDISFTIGPRKVKTLTEIAEQALLSGPERDIAITWAKDKALGKDLKNIQTIKDETTGFTTMYGLDQAGRVIFEQKYKTDYSGAQKRQQAAELKQTGVATGVSEETGQPTVTYYSPSGGVSTVTGPTKVAQTAAEKSTEATKQKLTQNIVKTDAKGNLILIPVKGGKMGEEQKGPQIESKLRDIPEEARVRMTNQRNIALLTGKVRDHIDNQLAKEGYTIDDLSGPITGRLRNVYAKLFDDPEFVKLRTELKQMMTVVYGLSGKQLNQWELSWLSDDILPDLKMPTGNLMARLGAFEDWIQTNRITDAATALEAGYPAVASGDLRSAVEAYFKREGSLTTNPPDIEKLSKGAPTALTPEKAKILNGVYEKYPWLKEQGE